MRNAFAATLTELATADERVVLLSGDIGNRLFDPYKQACPGRFLNCGVAEANMTGMAAGMALDGLMPYVNTIATFITRRCYEQVAMDVCLHDLPVRLIGNGGGVVYAPLGPTHLATEDIAIMRALPNMTVVCPADAEEMVRFMDRTLDWPHPIYIRLAKGGDPHDREDLLGRAAEPEVLRLERTAFLTGHERNGGGGEPVGPVVVGEGDEPPERLLGRDR